jgi:catechol 2,3-dioxygenase-like lactoylglutathione lyase family enzyme
MSVPLTFHHVGCVVANVDAGLATYNGALGARRHSRAFDVSAQGVRVCFVELGPGSYLELIQPTTSPSHIDRYAKIGFYHLCFLVDDLEAVTGTLGRQYVALAPFASEAFDGRRCQFLLTPERHLVELAEMTVPEFQAFFEASAA